MSFLEKLFGSGNDKEIKRLNKSVEAVLALDGQMQALSDEALKAKTAEFRRRYDQGETLDELMVEAFAVLRRPAGAPSASSSSRCSCWAASCCTRGASPR